MAGTKRTGASGRHQRAIKKKYAEIVGMFPSLHLRASVRVANPYCAIDDPGFRVQSHELRVAGVVSTTFD
jgi:hypothetical protein